MEPIGNHRSKLHDYTAKDHADHRHQLDQDVQAGAGSIFERVADGVADNGGSVDWVLGAIGQFLPAVGAFFDVLLGVIPGPAGVVQHDRQ